MTSGRWITNRGIYGIDQRSELQHWQLLCLRVIPGDRVNQDDFILVVIEVPGVGPPKLVHLVDE